MRTTITLDDDLLEKAMRLTGIKDRTPLIRESLKAIIARESGRRLALLGGSMPELQLTPRRQPEPEPEPEITSEFAPKLAPKLAPKKLPAKMPAKAATPKAKKPKQV